MSEQQQRLMPQVFDVGPLQMGLRSPESVGYLRWFQQIPQVRERAQWLATEIKEGRFGTRPEMVDELIDLLLFFVPGDQDKARESILDMSFMKLMEALTIAMSLVGSARSPILPSEPGTRRHGRRRVMADWTSPNDA